MLMAMPPTILDVVGIPQGLKNVCLGVNGNPGDALAEG